MDPCSNAEEEENGEFRKPIKIHSGLIANDARYVEPKIFYEHEVEIFARLPCFEYWKLQLLNKKFLQLLKSCEIFRVRQERGLVKPYVFIHSGGKDRWTMFDEDFMNFRRLPEFSSDDCFFRSDKETISAGTQLIVIGKEIMSVVVWRYELENNRWFKGPSMITPRVMYGSASRGDHAFFAGGIHINEKGIYVVVNTAEKYNARTKIWTEIQGMHKPRKFSSGCFLRGNFYVLGGRDENDKHLTCGERYDELTNSWEMIPNMLKNMTLKSSQSPPLIAVVKDNLYLLETFSSELCVYDTNANVWKKLGVVPVSTNNILGWGVAFKSIGDKLLLVGPSKSWHRTIVYYTCCPSPNLDVQLWEELRHGCSGHQLHHFIKNCCVMFA